MLKKVFICVPVFNEESRVAEFLDELNDYGYPMVVVEDGSEDNSNTKLKSLEIQNLTLLEHEVNLGKGAAMKTAAEGAFGMGAEAIIFMDSDGQHDPKDLFKFVDGLQDNDVVFGERKMGKHFRLYGSFLSSLIAKTLFGIKLDDLLCGYRGLTKKGYESVKWLSREYEVETEMVVRAAKSKIKYSTVSVKSIYHDIYKGFTLLDGFRILLNIFYWKLTI